MSHFDKKGAVTPEFSRRVTVANISTKMPLRENITANAEECAALAKRFALPAIKALSAEVVIINKGGELYQVKGRLKASVEQNCVITLDPVAADIEEAFEVFFAEPSAIPAVSNDMEFDLSSDEEMPEPIVDGKIDIGELTAQYLSLALDPYPHAEGVMVEADGTVWREHQEEENKEQSRPNPFAVLKDLK